MAKITFQTDVLWSGEGVRSEAVIRDKRIVIDEPKSLGGTDQGPNPVELILAALGGCLSVLLSIHAKTHQVELNGFKVHVEGDLDPDGFMEKNPAVRPGFQEIRYRIEVDSPSDVGKIRELIGHIEKICPVKDTLSGVTVKEVESTK
ncbi:OsmC family protein [[Clostridium] ultunense Esp]|uniref:OsmC family protein n=1 Tax=Thermicanus aegyptius TaxID=94009 RepID=UPI0002B7037E|nr:OsmC family protein [Thermicanus aegyptius]CCQ95489.1 OsmC family protein [[Clostridium] ultunense Esp]